MLVKDIMEAWNLPEHGHNDLGRSQLSIILPVKKFVKGDELLNILKMINICKQTASGEWILRVHTDISRFEVHSNLQ